MIYFIQTSGGGPIKIGFTLRGNTRFNGLRSELKADFKILGVMDGRRPEEKALHERFADLRIKGEWFRADEPLLSYIAEHRREWDGEDELQTVAIRVSPEVARLVRLAAIGKHMRASDYLNQVLEPIAHHDAATAIEKMIADMPAD